MNIHELFAQIHFDAYRLLNESLDRFFPNAGNMGIFTQSDSEYLQLVSLRDDLVYPSDDPNLKYFELKEPIVIKKTAEFPEAIYTHLYIRKPDPTDYGKHRGDVDFYTEQSEYEQLLVKVKSGEIQNAEVSEQTGVGEMIEISGDPQAALAYISTKEMTVSIRVRH